MTDPTHSPRGELTPGTPVLGRCVVERFVRRGPLASVYTARPRAGGGDAYMLRVVHGDLVTWSERGAAAFTREIERVKSLKHPSIPRVVAYDCAASGPLLLTAQTGGKTLRELMQRNERPAPGELAKIIAAVAAALDAMHHHPSAPIMHRAVSPENILVSERGRWIEEAGLVQAVVAGELVPDRASYFCFPGYQAPEEFNHPPDPRGDAFGLALVAFEALTGHPAFESLGPSALSALIHVGQLPRATEFCPELPSTVDTLFERAWAPNPSDGYVGPVAFSVDFSAVIESLGAHANRVLVPSGLVPSSLPPPNDSSSPEVHITPAPAVAVVSPPERSARPTLRMGSGAVPQTFAPTTIPRLPGVPFPDDLTPVILNPLIPPAAYGPSAAEHAPVIDPLLQPPVSGERPVVPNATATAPVPVSALPHGPHDPPPTFQPRQEHGAMNAQSVDPLISLPSLDGPASSPGFEFADFAPRASRSHPEPRAPEPEVSSPELDSSALEAVAPEPLPEPPAPIAAPRTPPPPLPRVSDKARAESPSHKAPAKSATAARVPSSLPPVLTPETLSKPFWRPSDSTILGASRALSLSTVIAAVVATIGLVQASRTLDALSSEPVMLTVDPPTNPPPVANPEPPPPPPPPPPPAELPDVLTVPSAPTAPAVMVFDAGPTTPPAANAGPVAPSPDQIPSDASRRGVFGRLRPLVSDCVEGLDEQRFPVRVRYTGSTGAVEAVHLRGIFADAPIGPCIEEAVRSVRMPSFPASQWEYTYMFTVPPPR